MTTDNTTITVYTKPACPQCDATKFSLNAKGMEFDTVDISVDAAAYDMVMALGHRSAPVVIAGSESWAGFQPDRINALAAKLVA